MLFGQAITFLGPELGFNHQGRLCSLLRIHSSCLLVGANALLRVLRVLHVLRVLAKIDYSNVIQLAHCVGR